MFTITYLSRGRGVCLCRKYLLVSGLDIVPILDKGRADEIYKQK